MNFKRLLLPVFISIAGLFWLFSFSSVEAQVEGEQEVSGTLDLTGYTGYGVTCTDTGATIRCTGTLAAGVDYLRVDMTATPNADADWRVRGMRVVVSGTQSNNQRIHWMQGGSGPLITNGMDPSWLSDPAPDGQTGYCWARSITFYIEWGYLCAGGQWSSTNVMNEWNTTFSGDYDRLYMYLRQAGSSNVIDLEIISYWAMLDPDPGTTPTETVDSEQALGVFPCVVTYTETITNDSGITTTQTITYTVPDANLVENGSFEDVISVNNNLFPQYWNPVKDGSIDYSTGDIISLLSRNGVYAIYSREQYELWGKLDRVIPSGFYRAGFYAACSVDISCNYDLVSLSVGSFSPTATHVLSLSGSSYQSFSTTLGLGGGSPDVVIDFNSGGEPYTLVDDVFVYPVDSSGNISCSVDLYPPDEYYTDPIGSIPGPIGAAGAVCYQCTIPNNPGANMVSYWVAWLGCVLRNMFSCSLRVWLLIIGNWISGLINQGLAWIAWVPLTVYQAADWFNEYVLPAISSISLNIINTEAQTNGWDVLIALIDLLSTIISTLSDILLGLVNFFGDLIAIIPNAINAEPRYLTLEGTEYTGSGAIDVSGEGGSNAKAVYLFFMGIQWVDSILFANESVVLILYVVMGLATFLVIWWSAQFWSDLISI